MKRQVPPQVQVLCYDFKAAISARMLSFDDEGCDLSSLTLSPDAVFPRKCQLLLRLHDSRSCMVVNVRAKLSAFIRENGQWIYRLRWDDAPAFLVQLAEDDHGTLASNAVQAYSRAS